MAGLLDLFGGGGNTGDLSQLVRPPDPLSDALAAMSERFAKAGEASRLPTSTLGAIGSALGGASTAARAAQTQYLDQAIKVQTLKRSLMAMGYDEKFAEILAQERARQLAKRPVQPGVAPAATPMPGAPTAVPAAAPSAPTPTASPFALPNVPDYSGAFGPATPAAPAGMGGGDQGSRARMQLTSLLGNPGGGLLADPGGTIDPNTGGDLLLPNQGGAGAAVMPASFRPADLVAPDGRAGNGAGDAGSGLDLRGLLSLASAGGGAADPFAGLLATDAPIQAGGPDTLVKGGDQSQLPIERASVSAPRSKEDIVRTESGGNPNVGYGGVDLSNKPHDPETGFPQWEGRMGPAGISHAAGKYQFQPRTWAEGARALGINDFSEKSQDAVYEWTRAKYGDAPWRASEGGGGRPNVQLAQYAPGGGQGGAPSPTAGPLGMTPETIALLNAYATLAGRGAPFKEFLDVYYKNPEYLQEAARAGQRGKSEVDLIYQPLIQGMSEAAKNPALKDRAQSQAEIDRVTEEVKQRTIAGYKTDETIPIPGRNGQVIQMPLTAAQKADILNGKITPEALAQRLYGNAAMLSPAAPSPGAAPPGSAPAAPPATASATTPPAAGTPAVASTPPTGSLVPLPNSPLPQDFEWRRGPDGTVSAQPIPGTPAAQKAEENAKARAVSDRQLQVSRDAFVAAADRAEYLAKTYPNTTTGIVGSRLTGVWQPSQDMQAVIQTLEARTTLDALNAMKSSSPTGASGLGSLTEKEGTKLSAAMANLKQSQSQQQFLDNLQIVKQEYINLVHGPGAWKQLTDEGVLKTPSAATPDYKEGTILNHTDGSQIQLKGNQWVTITPPTKK